MQWLLIEILHILLLLLFIMSISENIFTSINWIKFHMIFTSIIMMVCIIYILFYIYCYIQKFTLYFISIFLNVWFGRFINRLCSMVSSKYYCILVGIIFIYIYILGFVVNWLNNNNEVVLYTVNKTNFGIKLCGLPKYV